tara:strand:+ start:1342 stop:1731 length:390 start_codon:yes stop_codon:yes gene_type:complete
MEKKVIQVVGYPCSGKTTWIHALRKNQLTFDFLDLKAYSPPKKEKKLLIDLQKTTNNTIVESACGFYIENSIVINVSTTEEQYKINQMLRQEFYNSNQLKQIQSNMVPYDYIAHDLNSFYLLVKHLLKD